MAVIKVTGEASICHGIVKKCRIFLVSHSEEKYSKEYQQVN